MKQIIPAALFTTLLLAPSADAARKNIWLTADEIATRDTTTYANAWENIRLNAKGDTLTKWKWDAPNLKVQNENTGAKCIAAAIYWLKTGNTVFRDKVKNAIMAMKASADEPSEWADTTFYELGPGRRLGAYIIAADLIDMQSNYPSDDSIFRSWLRSAVRETIAAANPAIGKTLTQMAEAAASGGSLGSANALLASRIYLDQADSVARSWQFFKALTNRSEYPTDAYVPVGATDLNYYNRGPAYTDSPGRPHFSWVCNDDTVNWTAISASCNRTFPVNSDSVLRRDRAPDPDRYCANYGGLTTVSKTRNISGALVMDVCRQCKSTCAGKWYEPGTECYPHHETGYYRDPPDSVGMMYSWGSVQDLFITAEMFHRVSGPYKDSYVYGGEALRRVMSYYYGFGTAKPMMNFPYVQSPAFWVANYRYGPIWEPPITSLLQTTNPNEGEPDDAYGFTDWTHADPPVISVDDPPISGEPAIAQTMFRVSEARERKDLYDLSGRKAKAEHPGVYFQRIVSKAGVVTRRVVVVR